MPINSLSTALSGLRAAQSGLNLIAGNIANASTPGFSRQFLPQQAQVTQGGVSLGVQIGEIVRKVDTGLLRDVFGQSSRTAELNTRESFLSRLQAVHGPAEAEAAISNSISRLSDSFAALSADPDDSTLLGSTVADARDTATTFNDLANAINDLRNDTQNDLETLTNQINSQLESIADLNGQIGGLSANGRSVANLLDQRDQVLRELSQSLDISFFDTGNDQITVLGANGNTLVDNQARRLIFNPGPLNPTSSVENGGSARLFIESNGSAENIDITGTNVGGSVQALLTLRDDTFPQYTAQVDELAQKTAIRFAEQGLDLFVGNDGQVPENIAPPATVDYTGFASQIRVNQAVIDNTSLLRTGTNGENVLPGSNTVINRILEFTFGNTRAEQSLGNVDISTGTIFAATGLTQSAQTIGNQDITNFPVLTDNPDIVAGTQLIIDIGAGPVGATINLGDTPADLINNINAATGTNTARLNSLGQVVLENAGDITLGNGTLGPAGLAALGLSAGTTAATNPSFTVQVGQESPVTISIGPADTQADILASLNAIDGVTAGLNANGFLQIDSLDANGVNRGRLTITDIEGGASIGLGLNTSGVAHAGFRSTNLGADGAISTDLTGSLNLGGYSKSLVSFHAEEHSATLNQAERETTFFNTLNERQLNENGVDIDTELASLIQFQTAYTAAARILTATEDQFDELINAVR